MTTTADGAPASRKVVVAILAAGLTAATFDYLFAMGLNHLDWITIGHAITRGWYGNAAMQGGLDVALVGVVSHYAILLAASAIFVLASLRFPIHAAHGLDRRSDLRSLHLWRDALSHSAVIGGARGRQSQGDQVRLGVLRPYVRHRPADRAVGAGDPGEGSGAV